MGTGAAADPEAVGTAVTTWASARFGGPVALAERPASVSGGMDSAIHLVRLTGEALPAGWRAPLVVRVLPTAARHEQARREALVQGWCADQGYPTPRVLAVAAPGELLDLPVQVMERVPGTTMVTLLAGRPWQARSLVDRLARLHVALHRLDTTRWPDATGVGTLLERRLALVRTVSGRLGPVALTDALARVDGLRSRLDDGPVALCHGDLHPLNVLVDGPRASVVDWTDAGLGDRHGDVARTALLFRVAAVTAASTAERVALGTVGPLLARRYLRSYGRLLPLDPARLRLWEPVHLLHGWAQLEADATGLPGPDTAAGAPGRRAAPGLGTWLRDRFERRMAELA